MTVNTPRTLLVMAGGTGGHIFPALSVAKLLAARGWKVVWLGNASGMEGQLVPKHGFPLEPVRFGGVRGKGFVTKFLLPLNLLRAFWQSLGGYITFPGGMMSVLVGAPLVLHEQNSIAGLANRVLARVADRVLCAFPNALPGAEWVGNPIRADLATLPSPQARYAERTGPLRVLVVGGSLGAAALNDVVPKALALLPTYTRPIVVHQAGAKQIDTLRANYAAAGIDETHAQAVPFIDDMAAAYAQADLVICRAGAMTVSEVAAAGVAALFVPFPHAVDDHQTTNARFLSERGAALLVPQSDLGPASLADTLASLTRAQLADMAAKAREQARPEAAERVADVCVAVARA
jgi:UDP-N-acetylglucosamine--N-acetylmuramyl-(pentapeptide) pyrophosphoryl-undecaprenol N-acetylglucosamine transferase